MISALIAAAVVPGAVLPGFVRAAPCGQALAIGLDVSASMCRARSVRLDLSGSVDAAEYALQINGLGRALLHPSVQAAILAEAAGPVSIAVYDWSGPEDARLVARWTELADRTALQRFVADLVAVPRQNGAPATAVGTAMLFGTALLGQRAGCGRLILDLVGEGASNVGPRPRDLAGPGTITVNALVIEGGGTEVSGGGTLADWYRAEVLRGPDAFAEIAAGFSDFEPAMVANLLRELSETRIGQGGAGGGENG